MKPASARGAKPESLGNVQCRTCLNIFEIFGELPQSVECPRCGSENRYEWKAKP